MKKETLKRNLYQADGFQELLDHIAQFLPDETDFGIFQVNPDATVQVLHPIERPGFSANELLQHIQSEEVPDEAFRQVTEGIARPFVIEIADDGDINKLSIPDSGAKDG
jgi:hypothetical protein